MSEIPHPFIEETMKMLDSLPEDQKAKVKFIHLNHTNPALRDSSDARKEIEKKGFRVAYQLQMTLL